MLAVSYETYVRKSQEPDDRQVLSLPGQSRECEQKFGSLKSTQTVAESCSAKAPGRPLFNDLLDRVERGVIQGIIAWHPDRLSRNSVDAGRIIYLLDTGQLKDLKFVSYTFENTPEGKWMLAMIMGQAKYQVDKLTIDVKRGNREKYERGGITWRAMQGYQNNPSSKSIEPDPDRFPLVRKMWDLLLSGSYSVPQIRRAAIEEWGYRTRKHGAKSGDRFPAMSLMYRMFRNPLYAGLNIRPDGTVYETSHRPMINVDEYWRAQRILGRKGRSKPKTAPSAYAGGLLRCGECGCSITVDHKRKTLKSGKVLEFEYMRCTKKRGHCGQPHLPRKTLDQIASERLERIGLPEPLAKWLVAYVERRARTDRIVEIDVQRSQGRGSEIVEHELHNLLVMRRKDQIEESEFLDQRAELLAERQRSAKASQNSADAAWIEPALRFIEFGSCCLYRFQTGDDHERRTILESIFGSNLVMRDRFVRFEPVGPFLILDRRLNYANWQTFAEDIRTYFLDHPSEPILGNLERTYGPCSSPRPPAPNVEPPPLSR